MVCYCGVLVNYLCLIVVGNVGSRSRVSPVRTFCDGHLATGTCGVWVLRGILSQSLFIVWLYVCFGVCIPTSGGAALSAGTSLSVVICSLSAGWW